MMKVDAGARKWIIFREANMMYMFPMVIGFSSFSGSTKTGVAVFLFCYLPYCIDLICSGVKALH